MQDGDLATWQRERLIVILEGVLAQVVLERHTTKIRRRQSIDGYHIIWHEVPLKRLAAIGQRWPDYEVEIVTFHDQKLVDLAADYLDEAHIPYTTIRNEKFERFTSLLKFQQNIRTIYDSDPDRLDSYGQLGRAVVRGDDF